MRTWVVALGFMLACVMPAVASAATAEDVARGLEAQYQATLIRERRLADEREQRLLADAAARLQQARARADSRAAGAEAELARARAEYAALTEQIVREDAEARELSEAYAMQLERELGAASSEQLDALQRFADGDLRAGFDQYRAESRRRDAARRRIVEAVTNAADAAAFTEARQAANMGATLVAYGRLSAAEGMELWQEVVRIDPTDSSAQYRLSWSAYSVGRTDIATAAANAARETARTDTERLQAASVLYSVHSRINDQASAQRYADEALALARTMVAAGDRTIQLPFFINNAAEVRLVRRDTAGSERLYTEARALAMQSVSDPVWHVALDAKRYQRNAAYGLAQIALARGNDDGLATYVDEAVRLAEDIVNSDGDVGADTVSYVGYLTFAGNIAKERGRPDVAVEMMEHAVERARDARARDVTNVQFNRIYSAALTTLADVYNDTGRRSRAVPLYRESLAIDRQLFEANPTSYEAATDHWISLWRVARYANGSWQDVIRAMEDARRRGLWRPEHERTLDQARILARGGGR